MPRVTLEFILPEEAEEAKAAQEAGEWKAAMWDYDYYLRNLLKHPKDDVPEEVLEALQEARDQLYRITEVRDLYLD